MTDQTQSVVKPLEWVETTEQGVTYHKAKGYCIHRVYDRFNTGSNWVCHWPDYVSRRWLKSLEAAKAAAQADYERRTLSALTGPVIPVAEAQAMVGAALSESCVMCDGTGMQDSGGSYPWGEAALVPCDHNAPVDARAALDAYVAQKVSEAVKAEREACAQICEGVPEYGRWTPMSNQGAAWAQEQCAALIRARSEAGQ